VDNSNSELKQQNTHLRKQLDHFEGENKRLLTLLNASVSSGLSNDELHQFNNAAALLDANIELALNALNTLSSGSAETINEVNKIDAKNYIVAAQSAAAELVDIVNP